MQGGERIEDRHLDGLLQPRAQIVGVALALDLGADPRQKLVGVDWAR